MIIQKQYISVDCNLRQLRNTKSRQNIFSRMNSKFNIPILIISTEINGNGSHMLNRVRCTEKYIYI